MANRPASHEAGYFKPSDVALSIGRSTRHHGIPIAPRRKIDGVGTMGAKYLPTHKDRKDSQRFQRNQATAIRPKTKAVKPPTKAKKK